ncbi:hypothetical protein MX143_31855 [Pseudomonas aeruginosa]|uniref:hypothetical protein n=1 Tax=Pseudomonas aeruginosa TaxID=287 RepID=UPI001FF5B77A|nr:hypothetical protein [Pseudomonas aeruginosa]MCK0983189.1 hypothetical protein [Pseudomonas aeruginosa]MCL8243587.1 hypothetical protein [Pseudomonas aeruginosa]
MSTSHIAAFAFTSFSYEETYGCTFFAPSLEEAKEMARAQGFRNLQYYPRFFMDRSAMRARSKELARQVVPESVLGMLLHDAPLRTDDMIPF